MRTIEESLRALKSLEGYEDLGRGATDEEVVTIEQELGFALPTEYRDFLLAVGFARWFGHAIHGVSPSPRYSVVASTVAARRDNPDDFEPFPADAAVVKEYAGGGWYVLYGASAEGAGEVALVLDELSGRKSMGWRSFAAFLEHQAFGVENWIVFEG